MSDISRTGCSLATDKPIKVGNMLEIKARILANGGAVFVRAEAMRIEPIRGDEAPQRRAEVRGRGKPDTDRAIVEFINRRQIDLRDRGLG